MADVASYAKKAEEQYKQEADNLKQELERLMETKYFTFPKLMTEGYKSPSSRDFYMNRYSDPFERGYRISPTDGSRSVGRKYGVKAAKRVFLDILVKVN